MDNKERGRLISISKKGSKYKKHKDNPTSFKKGIHYSKQTEFKKGNSPWNKGLSKEEYKKHFKMGFGGAVIIHHSGEKHPRYGKNHSKKTKEKISKTKLKQYKEHPEILEKIRNKLKGRKLSKEQIKKISDRMKGNKHPMWKGGLKSIKCSQCDNNIFRTNCSLNDHKNHFCSRECFNKWKSINIKGINHPNWLGGKSFEPYDIEFNRIFKKKIRKRDNQVCMLCGIHREKLNKALHIHHIDYNKKNTCEENCISLCNSCHMKTNTNREHWTTFFQSLLYEKYKCNY